MKLYLNEGETVSVVRNHKPESHAVVVANWGGELLGVREFCDGQPLEIEETEATPTNTQKLSATQIAADMEQWAEHLDQYSNESTFCRIHQWKRQLSAI